MIIIFALLSGLVQKVDFKNLITTGIKPWRTF